MTQQHTLFTRSVARVCHSGWSNMADMRHEVRVEERLKIKIGEAKNLQCRSHGSVGQRDVYCTLTLDQEEIFRTTTIERTLNPFFGEEFQFEVPRKFRYLSVYVYDRDRHLKQDKVLGKVALKREELNSYHNKDHWFLIRPVDADSEVQGKTHIEVKIEPVIKSVDNEQQNSRAVVRLIECSDLTIKNGNCDPFATVTMCYSNGKQETRKTKVKKKTVSPLFDEVLTFELPGLRGQNHDRDTYSIQQEDVEFNELRVSLWHDAPGMSDNVFLGEVRIPLREQQQQQLASTNAWYFLQPRSTKNRPSKSVGNGSGMLGSPSDSLGSLRLKIHYTADHVFPSHVYSQLRSLILQSVHIEPVTSSAAYILGEIVPCKLDAAQPLVRVFMHHGEIVPMIRALAQWEISKVTDANTIFRGNTLVSKMMDEVMRLAGRHYLHNTLRPAIDLVFQERKPCEIDSSRCKDPSIIQTNLANLKICFLLSQQEYVEIIFQAITSSALQCPTVMCQLFHDLKELASTHFKDNKEVKYSVISGFIFLRFFAPAILGPKLFDLTTEQIDSQTNRTLTLISKTIQSLGNLVSSRSSQQTFKEEYMVAVHREFYTEKHIEAVRQFLEIISASSNPGHRSLDSPVVLKEGVMIKRAQGRKRFGRKNFKQRYFRLTTQDLTYSKTKGKEPLCSIPLDKILAVERLQEDSFKMKNMFQIVQPERALYIQANNCVEEKEWIDILTKICQRNSNRLKRYHPSAYINGTWLCCRSSNEFEPGCKDVSPGSEAGLQMNLDPDRELQRIHSLFITHMAKVESLKESCECQAVYTGDLCFLPNFVIEDVQSCFKTLTQICEAAYELEQEHRNYLRSLARETKYGSKQAPIGDDNYLLLAASFGRMDNSILRKTCSIPN
ncbi:GTPase-activating protein isoform X1 [Schistocerca americana]|uniref:GTPase-activating protein isoform X1 n=1 Tax=Schistocerca americana TaxID=7009 RepID=UPI001F4F8D43|nr:GTPase-activating protein isoform X1 [Schistocerca americana]